MRTEGPTQKLWRSWVYENRTGRFVMTVKVKLMSLFEKYRSKVPGEKSSLPEGASVRDLAIQIGLPLESLRIITVNGKQETLDRPLADGDLIYFFPPAIGGG